MVEDRGSVFKEGGALSHRSTLRGDRFKRPQRTLRLPASALAAALCGAAVGWSPAPVNGQETAPQDWNTPRVLELVGEAQRVRYRLVRDPEFRSYKSQARGYVYFFFDREDTGERVLVKTDQIALEVYWRSPNDTRQRIVGLRDRKSLPTNIRYHLDHLVVIQDEFGDRIRIGDGDEVEAVVHPISLDAEGMYDYLLADSVTVTLPGAPDPIRVYEIQVRPRDFDQPGFVGSVFLDRATHAIVRMSFTFTPASYVDDYLDYIQISLENGLWLGKHWLPYRQQLELRREVPFLDIPAGSVIRGWFEIRDYEINPQLPTTMFLGPRITALPEESRRAFPFEDSLYAHIDLEGLTPPPAMEEIRAMAVSIAKERYLSGLGRLRLFIPRPTVSSVFRYNRAEGAFLAGGVSYLLRPWASLALHGGFSFGRQRPAASVVLSGGERLPDTGLEGLWNRPRFLGPIQAISGALNTLSTLTLEKDYQDIFFASGVRAFHTQSLPGSAAITLEAIWEEHRSAEDVVSEDLANTDFRPVLPVSQGTWRSLSGHVTVPLGSSNWTGDAKGLGGALDEESFGVLSAGLRWTRHSRARGSWGHLDLKGGTLLGGAPPQAHFLLGGRATLPGYSFRSLAGDRFWLVRAGVAQTVLAPWLRLRIFSAVGGTSWSSDKASPPTAQLPASWPEDRASRTLFSAGVGLGLGWDVLHLDLARGFSKGGGWEISLAVNGDFWPWL